VAKICTKIAKYSNTVTLAKAGGYTENGMENVCFDRIHRIRRKYTLSCPENPVQKTAICSRLQYRP